MSKCEVKFKTYNVSTISYKASAFKTLFESDPVIYVTGTFRNSHDELVFGTSRPIRIISINITRMHGEVDGEMMWLRAYEGSQFEVTLQLAYRPDSSLC